MTPRFYYNKVYNYMKYYLKNKKLLMMKTQVDILFVIKGKVFECKNV